MSLPTVLLPSSVMVRLAVSVRQKFTSAPVALGTPPFQFSGWLQLSGIVVPLTLIARIGEPLRLLAGQHAARAVVVFVLNLLGLRDAHAVAAPVVGEEAGETDVVDGVLADHDDLVPVGGGGEARAAPAGGTRISLVVDEGGPLLAKCSLTNSVIAGTPAVRYVFFELWYLPCAQARRDA